jgi:CHASE3 domain sensor protein
MLFGKKTALEVFEQAQAVFTKTLDQLEKALTLNAEEQEAVKHKVNKLNTQLISEYATEGQLRKDAARIRAMQRRIEGIIDG